MLRSTLLFTRVHPSGQSFFCRRTTLPQHHTNVRRYQVKPEGIRQIELLMFETSQSPSDTWALWAAQFTSGSFVVRYRWFDASARPNSPGNPALGKKRTYTRSQSFFSNTDHCESGHLLSLCPPWFPLFSLVSSFSQERGVYVFWPHLAAQIAPWPLSSKTHSRR